MYKAGYFNKNFASATFDAGTKAIATGEAAHYPMLTSALSSILQNSPDNINDVGFFPLPAQDAADTRVTVWMPNALYIPKTTEGAKLEAAKKFIAFANSPEGCKIQGTVGAPAGPFSIKSCTLPDNVAALVKDIQPYADDRQDGPGAGVPVTDQGSEPGADHRRGGLRHPERRRRRQALRRGREEAGPAAWASWLVS